MSDFLAKAKQAGDVVTWAGDWLELADLESGAPHVIAELGRREGFTPLIQAQFFTQSTGELLRPLDAATRRLYKDAAAAFAARHRPIWLAFGIEVNLLHERSPAAFDSFASFFPEVYDAVKSASPATAVFTVFQLEKMKGLSGGLFGGLNDTSRAQWELLDRFPRLDLVGFTSYPGLVHRDPSEMPASYYEDALRRAALHPEAKVGFTELGWHSAAEPSGWESTEIEQAAFVDSFFVHLDTERTEMAVWSFLYDPAAPVPFHSMGLFRSDGTAKRAWWRWAGRSGEDRAARHGSPVAGSAAPLATASR
jgi:hypothetical protein